MDATASEPRSVDPSNHPSKSLSSDPPNHLKHEITITINLGELFRVGVVGFSAELIARARARAALAVDAMPPWKRHCNQGWRGGHYRSRSWHGWRDNSHDYYAEQRRGVWRCQ